MIVTATRVDAEPIGDKEYKLPEATAPAVEEFYKANKEPPGEMIAELVVSAISVPIHGTLVAA